VGISSAPAGISLSPLGICAIAASKNSQEVHMEAKDPHMLTKELMMSPTMQRLASMACDCPFDVKNPEALKSALVSSGYSVIQALDSGDIRFTNARDRAMLHALLLSVMECVTDGRFGASAARHHLQ
jgi:hypothetical protein